MVLVKLKDKGKIIEVEVRKMNRIQKYLGLMIYKQALLFSFDKPGRHAIHSLFCPRFLAIWINNGKIVEYKLVNPWNFIVKPEKDFTELLEIPDNNKYKETIQILSEKFK